MNTDLRFARWRGLTAMLAVVLLVVTACGSDDFGDTSETTTSTTTTTTEVPLVTTTGSDGQDATTTPPADAAAPSDADDASDTTSLAPSEDQSPISGKTDSDLAGPVDPKLAPLSARAVADLASRLGVAESTITVIRAEMVVWPDSSRGCPQPGMRYLQVLTDGVWIVLDHDGQAYSYYTTASGEVALCQSDIKQRPAEGVIPGFGDT